MGVTVICQACGVPFLGARWRVYCSEQCRKMKAPAVYRFVCPDGRSYVGSRCDIRFRTRYSIGNNQRLKRALTQYPAETWVYEVLQTFPSSISTQELRTAEQHHIERLRTWDPRHGFNVMPAARPVNGPFRKAVQKMYIMRNRAMHKRLKIQRAEWEAKWKARQRKQA
jgi:hypothetical protein